MGKGKDDTRAVATTRVEVAEAFEDVEPSRTRKVSETKHRHRIKVSTIRGLVVSLVFLSVCVGLIYHTGTGTPSAFGIDSIAAVCPLGVLETMLGSKSFMLHPFLLLLITVILTLVLGKFFCSWVCPMSYLRSFFSTHKKGQEGEDAEELPSLGLDSSVSTRSLAPSGGERDGFHLDSRHVVLGGALLSSLLFGFPVFCLICPVGLSFATLIGLWRLFQFNDTSWGLIAFPLILLTEVLLLRNWCKTFCPLGALLSLLSSGNRLFRPSVKRERCLRDKGIDCTICTAVCPEQVDPHSSSIPECSRCGRCSDSCPGKAIRFPLFKERWD
jgi:ferredoxin-type protein NapH